MPKSLPICHIEIPTTDLAASMRFYREVFGWHVGAMPQGDYGLWKIPAPDGQGTLLSGGFDPSRAPTQDPVGVSFYVETGSLEATLGAIGGAGGTVVKRRTAIGGDSGYYAEFLDPSGNRLGIWSRNPE